MADRWVINASPILLLAKAEIIQFVPQLCDELVVPAGVVSEVDRGRMADAGRIWIGGDGRRHVRPVPTLHPAVAAWGGGSGEAEVISWALAHPGFTAVLDDRAARRLATKSGVPVLGSLRIIVRAKERGYISAARSAWERLRGSGAYVSDELIDRAIALAGEA